MFLFNDENWIYLQAKLTELIVKAFLQSRDISLVHRSKEKKTKKYNNNDNSKHK